MCFVLYMAADRPVPSIPCNEHDRKLSTSDLTDREPAVAGHFTKPHLKYVGSDLGCGCGFRSAMFQNGEWPEEDLAPEFHFRERFIYMVTLGGASTGGGQAAPSAAGHHSAERGCRTS